MDSIKLVNLQQAFSTSNNLIHQFVQVDQSVRSYFLPKLNAANSLGLSSVLINELCSDPEPLLNSLEFSDVDLVYLTAFSGGTGDSIVVGGKYTNRNVHSCVGYTNATIDSNFTHEVN